MNQADSEIKRGQEDAERYGQRLSVLRELDQHVLAAHSQETIILTALRHLIALTLCQRASLAMFDPERGEVELLAVDASDETRLELVAHQVVNEVEAVEELRSGEIWVQDDSPADGMSEYHVPLMVEGVLVGSLNLSTDGTRPLTPEQLDAAREIADRLAMADRMSRLSEQVQRHADELEQRVAERTADLRAANERLEALCRAKDALVTTVSHELRAPIANLTLRHAMMTAGGDELEDHLAVAIRETERVHRIVNGLVYLARLDQVALHRAAVDLNALVGLYVADRQVEATQKGLSLTFEGQPGLPLVWAEAGLLDQVWGVLLTNALSYTSAGGRIVVRTMAQESDGQAWAGVSVSDDGPGILPEEQPHLFKRFFRGSAGREIGESDRGLGLGLAIASEIMERHEGRIEVASEGVPGKGSTFSVWLPCSRAFEAGGAASEPA